MLEKTDPTLEVVGIEHHKLLIQPLCSAGGVSKIIKGNVVAILHEYDGFPTGRTIHSSAPTLDFDLCVDEKSIKVGGSHT